MRRPQSPTYLRYAGSLRPCLATPSAPRDRGLFRQTLLVDDEARGDDRLAVAGPGLAARLHRPAIDAGVEPEGLGKLVACLARPRLEHDLAAVVEPNPVVLSSWHCRPRKCARRRERGLGPREPGPVVRSREDPCARDDPAGGDKRR